MRTHLPENDATNTLFPETLPQMSVAEGHYAVAQFQQMVARACGDLHPLGQVVAPPARPVATANPVNAITPALKPLG